LAILLSRYHARLVVKGQDLIVETPLLDAWPVFEVFAFGEYDLAIPGRRNLQYVIDCGAHVGSFSLWIAARTGCRVFAVEPNPSIHGLLEENIKQLGEQLTIFKAAVAEAPGLRTLHDSGFPGLSSLGGQGGSIRTFTVQAVTLEDVLSLSGFPQVDLLKMDIEGAELEVLNSTPPAVLRRIKNAIIECHPGAGVDSAAVADRLAAAGGMKISLNDRMVVGSRD
jgi:FkbM family methyltransferase